MIKWIKVCLKKISFKIKGTRQSRGLLWKWFEFINKEDFEKDEKVLKIKEREKRVSYVQEGKRYGKANPTE